MSLLDSLMSMLTPPALGSISAKLGESPEGVQKGLKGAAATILATIGSRAGDNGFLQHILDLVKDPANNAAILKDPSSSVPQSLQALTTELLSTVLGSAGQQAAVAKLVADAADIKASSASSLIGTAGAMLLGQLGKQAASGTAASLGTMTTAELPAVSGYMPGGAAALLGSTGLAPHAAATAPVHAVEEAAPGGGGWVLPALIALMILGGLFWYFLRGPEATSAKTAEATAPAEEKAPVDGPAVSEASRTLWAPLGAFSARKLPNGVELNIPKLGVENKLIDFIADAGKTADKETWFDFDRLLFDTGKATLQPDSQDQLNSIAAILKTYPKVHVRVGGYTDNVGDKAANVKLSQDRAASVAGELVKLGIDGSRLDSKGYGDEHPVASNATAEGRAQNRRISLRVTEK